MYTHYFSQQISTDKLEELIEAARDESHELGWENGPNYVVMENADVDENDVIDRWARRVLNERAMDPDDHLDGCRPIDGADVLLAIRRLGLALGTVFEAIGHPDKVLKFDEEALYDARALALVEALPGWVQTRYDAIILRSER